MAGGLNPTTAKACADAICAALGVTDAAAVTKWEAVVGQLYTSLLTDIIITIGLGAIVTTGSATTQTGPAAPIPLSPGA